MNPFGRAKLKPQITMTACPRPIPARAGAGLFGGNDQNQFFFGILDFFIGICLLFGIYYLVFNRHPEKLYQ